MSANVALTTSETDSIASEHVEPEAHLGHGVIAGIAGAVTVAVVFLCIDLVTARAFATPNALGQAFFMGAPFRLQQAIVPEAVVAYTALHGGVFVAIAYFGASLLAATHGILSRAKAAPLVAIAMFLACQAAILSFAYASDFPAAEFNPLRIALANAFASGLMVAALGRLVDRAGEAPRHAAVLAFPARAGR